MTDDPSAHLLGLWRQGDHRAAEVLFGRYAERLLALARTRLSARLAGRVSPEGVVQSVYAVFFTAARDGRYALEHSGDLWRLLVTITVHKVRGLARRHSAGKRGVARERRECRRPR